MGVENEKALGAVGAVGVAGKPLKLVVGPGVASAPWKENEAGAVAAGAPNTLFEGAVVPPNAGAAVAPNVEGNPKLEVVPAPNVEAPNGLAVAGAAVVLLKEGNPDEAPPMPLNENCDVVAAAGAAVAPPPENEKVDPKVLPPAGAAPGKPTVVGLAKVTPGRWLLPPVMLPNKFPPLAPLCVPKEFRAEPPNMPPPVD